jgi:ferric-dicitrate binding protein FerR (iron transport regulator)
MDDKKIIALIEGYSAGTLTEEETSVFFEWYHETGLEEFHRLYSQCNLAAGAMAAYPEIPDEFKERLEQAIQDYEANQQPPRTISIFRRYRLGWAAAILLLIGVGGYFIYQSQQPQAPAIVNNTQPSGDVAPGTTKAVLTLADGRQVTLDTVRSGTLAVQGKTIVQHDQGAITYNNNTIGKGQSATQSVLYNTLTTNRGEQSPPLVLSDGTKVWLNALSSIRFPVAFTGNSRNVEITGEVFFEVARNAAMPFHVKVKDMEVEVLGTQFNVNAYDDEPLMNTTLVEGKVKVSSNGQWAMLKPGEQASVSHSSQPITVQAANIDQVVAWKNGVFDFNHANLQTVLRQLSRWYDIDVKFEGDVPVMTFRGKMTRDLTLSQVTKALQDVKIKFRIEGNTLIVTK